MVLKWLDLGQKSMKETNIELAPSQNRKISSLNLLSILITYCLDFQTLALKHNDTQSDHKVS